MCGRYTLTGNKVRLKHPGFEEFDEVRLTPRFNVCPSQDGQVFAVIDGTVMLRPMRFGLIPSWAKDEKSGFKTVNARAETVAEKPSFRSAFRRRRCLVLADGWYEWQQEPGTRRKIPYHLHLSGRRQFVFGGIWETWQRGDADPLHSFSIITTEPNDTVARVHDRQPLIIPPEAYDRWLDPGLQKPEEIATMIRQYPGEGIEFHPVSTLVNKPANDSEECIRPVEGPLDLFHPPA